MESTLVKTGAVISFMLIFALAATGCSKTPSSNVKTGGIHVSYSIEGDNQGQAICKARFQVGGPTGTFLDLDEGDSVTCQSLPMQKQEIAGIIVYSARVAYAPRGNYVVTFTRAGESSYQATVRLPEPIEGMNPMSFRGFQKSRPISILWTPSSNSADGMTVILGVRDEETSSFKYKNGGQPESGRVVFSSVDTEQVHRKTGSLGATLTYERSRSGSVPSPLSGTIHGIQRFEVPIELTD